MAEQLYLETGDDQDPTGGESGAGGEGVEDGTSAESSEDPLAALQAQLEREKEARIRAEARAEARESLRASQPPPVAPTTEPPKTYTRAELARKVENDEMTREEADRILDRQMQQDIERRVEEATARRVREARINEDLDRYLSKNPELNQPGSEIRARVERQYRELISEFGDPESAATELKAVKMVLGPLENRMPEDRTAQRRHTHVETSGGGSSPADRRTHPTDEDGAPRNLSNRLKSHYRYMIDRGFYSGWKDERLKRELGHIGKSRQRVGIHQRPETWKK